MKKQSIILVVIFILVSITNLCMASDPYHKAMTEQLEKMYKTNSVEELVGISGVFLHISEKEQRSWLPLYYATYSLVRIAFFTKDADLIDKYLYEAQIYMDMLKEKQPKESEIFVLQSLLYAMKITGPARGIKYSVLSNNALDEAEEMNASNPRVFYCRGNNLFHTPSFFGGGKDKALPFFKKAKGLYDKWESPQDFWPAWGADHNLLMLKQCEDEE